MAKDNRWLVLLCAGRVGLSLIFTAYSAVLPLVAAEWKISGAQAGSVQSAWQVGYLVSLFAAGILADRFGARQTLLRMSVASAAASLVFALFSRGYLSALILYGAAGLCSGGSYTPGLKLVFERAPPESRGAAMGFFLSASSIGYALALALSALVIPLLGWRAALILCAAANILGAAVVWAGLRKLPDAAVGARHLSEREDWADLFRNRAAIACILAYTFHCWELLGMWAWLPSFAVRTHAGEAGALTSGLIVVATSHLVSSLGSVVGGRLSDALGRPFVMLFMSAASLLCSFSLGWLAGGPSAVIFTMVVAYNLFAIGDSAVYSTAMAEVVPARRLGAAYSVRSVLGFGAGAISPWVFGSALDLGHGGPLGESTAWGLAWTSLGLGALPGIPMILWFRRLARHRPKSGGP